MTQRPNPRSRQGRGEQKFVDDLMYVLTAPIVVLPQYTDSIQNQHRERVQMERLLHAKEILETERCTVFECNLYLSCASFERPLSHAWAQIYMWCFQQSFPEQAPQIMTEGPVQLDRQEEIELDHFRAWIFRVQMNYIKAQSKDFIEKEVTEEKQQLDEEGEQLNLF